MKTLKRTFEKTIEKEERDEIAKYNGEIPKIGYKEYNPVSGNYETTPSSIFLPLKLKNE